MGGMCVNSGLAHAPDWTPHRLRVTAADPAAGTVATKASGMVSEPFEDVFADIKITGATGPSIDLEVLFWSELNGLFVSQQPAVTFTAIAVPKIVKFNAGGNRFLIRVSGTFGSGSVDISCAGGSPIESQSA